MSGRTRTTGPGFVKPYSWAIDRTTCAGSNYRLSSGTVGIQTGWTKVTTDSVTPNFRRRILRGEIINNSYSSVYTLKTGSATGALVGTYTPSCSGSTVKTEVQTRLIGGGGYDAFLGSAGPIGQAKILAGTQALANVSDPDVSGLVELAELHKTIAMIRDPIGNIKDFIQWIRGSKRYRNSPAKNLGSFISGEWLRYRYGIAPLVGSVNGIMKAIKNEKTSKRKTARGYAKIDYPTNTMTPIVTGYSWSTSTQGCTASGYVQVRAGVLYEHTFDLGMRYGFYGSEIPSAAWELVPYSFVADWFVNAGDFIRAITPRASVNYLADWTTTIDYRKFARYESSAPKTVSNWSISDTRYGWQTTETLTKSRSPGVSVGVTQKSITFNRSADWNHLADAFSLITGMLSRR